MKIVQIGTGGWGKNHCRVLSELGVLSAVCDKDLHLAEEFGKKYSVNNLQKDFNLIKNPNFKHYYELANYYKDNQYFEESIKVC